MLCHAKSLQSSPTLCDPIDGSPPGSPVPGILQARTLEWVAISFSHAWKWKVEVKSLSRVRLLATPWTAAPQAPPSMGFSRQEYWSGVPLPSPGPGIVYAYIKHKVKRMKGKEFTPSLRGRKWRGCMSHPGSLDSPSRSPSFLQSGFVELFMLAYSWLLKHSYKHVRWRMTTNITSLQDTGTPPVISVHVLCLDSELQALVFTTLIFSGLVFISFSPVMRN